MTLWPPRAPVRPTVDARGWRERHLRPHAPLTPAPTIAHYGEPETMSPTPSRPQLVVPPPIPAGREARRTAARLEPFDSYWQAPKDIEKGYRSFTAYYKANYLARMPKDRDASILVVSCGPGYLVNMLREHGYRNVLGIDSDPVKVEHARRHGLP